MCPWINVPEIITRQESYDPVRFRNEVLGLPTDLGEHLITRQEIERCCDDQPFARALAEVPPEARPRLVAGVDWGFGGAAATVLAIGYIERERIFRVVRMNRWTAQAGFDQVIPEVAEWCNRFRVNFIAADGGGAGRTNNRLLWGHLQRGNSPPHLYSIFYGDSDQKPVQEGVLWRWTVSRSGTIGTLFCRIKKQLLRFPRASESGSFLDDFLTVVAVYDDEMRTIRYTKPETLRDDALHAVNYAELVGLRMQGVG
jgi:hypothetical protein